VVTSRGDVHYVITEHGVAFLHGKTIRQRAEALIAVADPKFQPGLEDYARQSRLLTASRSVVSV
jgi:acyl-CoA hydrolase